VALLTADRQVQPGQAGKVLTDQPQHLRIGCIQPQAGTDARTRRWGGDV